MAKPSIFSKDYQNKMRNRKKRIRFTVFVIILLIIVVAAKGFDKVNLLASNVKSFNIKALVGDSKKKTANTNSQTNSSTKKGDNKPVENNNTATDQTQDDSKNFTVKITDSKTITVNYDVQDNSNIIKDINEDDSISYNISPSGKFMVVEDNSNQCMYLVDNNGNATEITKKNYLSSGGSNFERGTVLQANPNYIWCATPKFLSDDEIVYVSQIPWFKNDATKYMWSYKISTKTHDQLKMPDGSDIKGQNIKLDKLDDKGLLMIIDEVVMHIDNNLNVKMN